MRSLKFLNKYFLKYKWHLVLGTMFVIAQNIGAIYPAQVVRQSLDEVVNTLNRMHLGPDPATQADLIDAITGKVFFFLLLIIGVALMRGILMFFMRQTIIVMSRRIEFDLKNEIFKHYESLSLNFYRQNNTGDLMNRISEDVSRVRMYIGPAVMYTINLAILLILIILIMFSVNVRLTLFVLAPLPLLSLSIYYVSDLINRKSEEVQTQQSGLSTFVQESFSGIRILKSFVKEDMASDAFEKQSDSYKEKNMELVKVNAFFFPLMLLLVGLSTLLTVYIGGKEVIAGRASPGNIAEFIIYVNMLTWPVASLGWVTSLIQRAAASQERINEFLTVKPEIISGSEAVRQLLGKIEFRDLEFVYPESGIRALDKISFTVEAGSSLAILGKTGSGKSTVANLMLRMFDPSAGEIFIDDRPLRNYSLSSFRSQIGYVPQEVFLFSDTIANNIAFGISEGISEAERNARIEQAAADAVISDNIRNFPNQYETFVGERGITLSGGQKQRVSIARAIIKKPKILLFDDCLSAVDTHTEEQILHNLKKLMQDRTTVIISHRVSSVKNADQIIVLDNGKIIEQGDHVSLMRKKGVYFELFEKQLLEEEAL